MPAGSITKLEQLPNDQASWQHSAPVGSRQFSVKSAVTEPSSEMAESRTDERRYIIGYNHTVDVTHINDPKSFFVRAPDVDDLLKEIETPGPSCDSASDIKLRQRVAYKSNILQKIVRGDIQHIEQNNGEARCDIFAIDYGCRDTSVPMNDIYHLDSNSEPHNQCPGLATHCQLHLCEPRGETFNDEVVRTMKLLVGSHTGSINVVSKRDEQLVVELITADCPGDVATMLALIDLTCLTGKGTVAGNLKFTQLTNTLKYEHKKLEVGDVLHVRVQSGTSVTRFYAADVNDFKTLRRAEHSLSTYCKTRNMKENDFVPGRPCAVKLDKAHQYDRAIIKKVLPDSKAVLELVDWGIDVESSFSRIRSIDSQFFLSQPIIAMYCSAPEDLVAKYTLPSVLFKGYEFGIQIMELGNNSDKPHKINLYPLSKMRRGITN